MRCCPLVARSRFSFVFSALGKAFSRSLSLFFVEVVSSSSALRISRSAESHASNLALAIAPFSQPSRILNFVAIRNHLRPARRFKHFACHSRHWWLMAREKRRQRRFPDARFHREGWMERKKEEAKFTFFLVCDYPLNTPLIVKFFARPNPSSPRSKPRTQHPLPPLCIIRVIVLPIVLLALFQNHNSLIIRVVEARGVEPLS